MNENGEFNWEQHPGAQARDAGMALVSENNPSYLERFHAAAETLLRTNRKLTSQAVVAIVGMPAGSVNAVGAAMHSVAKRHGLFIAGYVTSERPSRHAGRIAVWETKTL